MLSENGGPVRSSLGVVVQTERLSGRAFDTLIIIGSEDASTQAPRLGCSISFDVIKAVKAVTSICTGAICPCRGGLAERPPRHHALVYGPRMQARFPEVKVEEDRIFIVDGPIWTSAGATAVLDLALALVEKDLGAEAARSVAKKLVMLIDARAVSPSIRNYWPCRRSPTVFKKRAILCREESWFLIVGR